LECNESQTNIAVVLGVTRQQVSQWETGIYTVPVKHAGKLCQFLDISPTDFLTLYVADMYDEIKKKLIA